ncbi:MAG: ribonuclease HI family protein [bacterium]
MTHEKLQIYTDGGARGNPGPAGIGVVIKNNNQVVKEHCAYIGETTNNQAEYQAIYAGLQEAHKLGAKELDCFLDSELVVNQLNRKYKVKDQEIGKWFIKIHNLLLNFKKVSFHHIYREDNKAADRLVNEAIDRGTK